MHNLKDLMEPMIQSRRKISDGLSFADILLQLDQTDFERWNDILVIMVAGYETTAGTLTKALWQLGLNQELQEEAREECKNMDTSSGNLKTLSCINNIIKETLRLHGPATAITRVMENDEVNFDCPETGRSVNIPKGP
eukprot:UN02530